MSFSTEWGSSVLHQLERGLLGYPLIASMLEADSRFEVLARSRLICA